MRFLDTREQKSPRFLVDAFPDLVECEHLTGKTGCNKHNQPLVNCPFTQSWTDAGEMCSDYKAKGIKPLAVGDYFSGTKEQEFLEPTNMKEAFNPRYRVLLKGNLVEIKIGKDFGIHTEQLERFQDELYRMSVYRQKNPHVQLHAVWVDINIGRCDLKTIKHFYSLCQKYHVWGHLEYDEKGLIRLLKEMDQPSMYKEFEPYLKRSHEEPTALARALRVVKGVSSDTAIQLSECETYEAVDLVPGIIKKDGTSTKLQDKIDTFLVELVLWYTTIWDAGAEP